MSPLIKGEDEHDWQDDEDKSTEGGNGYVAKFGRSSDSSRPVGDSPFASPLAGEEAKDHCQEVGDE